MFLSIYNFFRMEMNSGSVPGYFLQAVPVTLLVGLVYLILRLAVLRRKQAPVSWPPEAVKLAFVCYLTGLCSLVILPANFWLHVFDGIFFGWWESMGEFFRLGEINLVPTLVKCLSGEFSLDSWVKAMLVGNVVLFLPFGLFLPFAVQKLSKKQLLTVAAATPLTVEILQLFVGRSFDVDDLLCNFLGIILGLLLAWALQRLVTRPE